MTIAETKIAEVKAASNHCATRVASVAASVRDYVMAVNCISVSVLRNTYSRFYPALSLDFAPIRDAEYPTKPKERNI